MVILFTILSDVGTIGYGCLNGCHGYHLLPDNHFQASVSLRHKLTSTRLICCWWVWCKIFFFAIRRTKQDSLEKIPSKHGREPTPNATHRSLTYHLKWKELWDHVSFRCQRHRSMCRSILDQLSTNMWPTCWFTVDQCFVGASTDVCRRIDHDHIGRLTTGGISVNYRAICRPTLWYR